jgi:hypothetical protein
MLELKALVMLSEDILPQPLMKHHVREFEQDKTEVNIQVSFYPSLKVVLVLYHKFAAGQRLWKHFENCS